MASAGSGSGAPPPPGGGAAAAAGAEGVLAQERATEATALWLMGEYEAALQTLQRLEELLPQDRKVQHNEAVAAFYAQPTPDIAGLVQQLSALKDPGPADPPGTPPAHSSSAACARINLGLLLMLQGAHASALALLEPLWECVEALHGGAALRLALLLAELYLVARQPGRAGAVLEYMEGALAAAAAAAAAAAGAAEGAADGGGAGAADGAAPDGTTPGSSQSPSVAGQQQQASPGSAACGGEDAGGGAAAPGSGGGAAGASGEAGGASLAVPRVSRRSSPLLAAVGQLLDARAAGSAAPPAGGAELRGLLRLYRARVAVAAGRPKAAKRELRALLAALGGVGVSVEGGAAPAAAAAPAPVAAAAPALLLKAEVEAGRGQPRKALKSLGPLLTEGGGLQGPGRVALLNALALLHHHFGKHQAALLYLSKALSLEEAGPPAGAPVAAAVAGSADWALAPGSRCALLYNAGLQHLMLRDWGAARSCLEAAAAGCYAQPLLWLRLAEANLGLFMARAAAVQAAGGCAAVVAAAPDGVASTGDGWRRPLLDAALGEGQDARLLLPSGHALTAAAVAEAAAAAMANSTAAEGAAAGGSEPGTLLCDALLQLHTALALLADLQAEAAKADEAAAAAAAAAAASAAAFGTGPPQQALNGTAPPQQLAGDGAGTPPPSTTSGSRPHGAPAAAAELEVVQAAVLANLAYCHLLREDALPALSAAQALLACSGLHPQGHFLGACYAAEALCMLGRPADAAEALRSHLALYGEHAPAAGAGGEAGAGGAVGLSGTPGSAGTPPPRSVKSDDDGAGGREVHALGNAGALAALAGPPARGALLSNLGACAAQQGDLEAAAAQAGAALEADPGCGAAQLLLVWVRLRQGDCEGALSLLRQLAALPGL